MSAENNKTAAEFSQNWKLIKKTINSEKPLIHHITNNVTVNDCANLTLNWGALPVMAPAAEESAQMVENASALVLNLGTISSAQLESMLQAGRRANQLEIPIVLDPVGVGATKFRTEAAQQILSELKIDLIKGNKGEISLLAGKTAEVKGVESIGEYEEIAENALLLAQRLDTAVVVSSETDLIAEGSQLAEINRGHPLMGKVVGTGCMLGSTLAVFAAAAKKSGLSLFEAAKTAVYYYSLAGEKAAAKENTPARFKIEFMDQIYLLG
ncbi:hydroxyethylthiazole kinase [Halanaerobium saccharolyticum]|uniref:Hydroxyethylthiazole kinase n=1 Tax=Halanaerobium saccharolyticum TaxID=43595 RepID=A0A4R7Z113_9FIRM|nr:hydroxyethylthiazole kinase [Halanaerobium saccharolyticum]RAK08101.1 hydroxyethylthiazole kinase [Halanaerobium saccharolyticum]TDW04308.1 hydroxyethylthiazole kinase [Halanaerobium saccharolyticum]TDX59599.1 hydroxyethylthiazole kinase [Halanaerobium saccharolyticum]